VKTFLFKRYNAGIEVRNFWLLKSLHPIIMAFIIALC